MPSRAPSLSTIEFGYENDSLEKILSQRHGRISSTKTLTTASAAFGFRIASIE